MMDEIKWKEFLYEISKCRLFHSSQNSLVVTLERILHGIKI